MPGPTRELAADKRVLAHLPDRVSQASMLIARLAPTPQGTAVREAEAIQCLAEALGATFV